MLDAAAAQTNLCGTNAPFALSTANQFRAPFDGDGNPQLLRALWPNELLHGQSSAPPLYTVPAVPSASDDQLNAQADLRYRSQLDIVQCWTWLGLRDTVQFWSHIQQSIWCHIW